MRQSRKILSACMALALCLTPLGAGADAAPQASSYNPTVGIWYSTWYAKEGPYLWIDGHGYGSVGQFLEDVNGDGKDDAVICFENGDWYVALSTGAGFGGYSRWGAGHGSGAAKRLMGDVNGDGKADAIAYFGDGDWYVALSTGSGFGGASRWFSGLGVGSANQFIADVNGDGKEDAVIFNASGSWYASLSNGSGFNNYSQWTDGHGYGSNSQFLEDVDGDGRADAIVFFSGDGSWYVSTSRGGDFSGYSRWLLGFGAGSQKQLFADVNGDGKKGCRFLLHHRRHRLGLELGQIPGKRLSGFRRVEVSAWLWLHQPVGGGYLWGRNGRAGGLPGGYGSLEGLTCQPLLCFPQHLQHLGSRLQEQQPPHFL